MRKCALFVVLTLTVLYSSVAWAQAPVQADVLPTDWKLLLTTFINTTLVLLVVTGINRWQPLIREQYPWVVPLLATAIGPLVGLAQSWLLTKLGLQVDFSPIVAALAGAAATTAHQVAINTPQQVAKRAARRPQPAA